MESNLIQKWFAELKRVWLEKDIEGVKKLLSEEFEYYENPFELPLTSWTEVKKVWEEINGQDILVLDITVLIDKDNIGVACYDFICKGIQRQEKHTKGAFYVKLDSVGRAVEFRQWWNG